jgi:hypothetical protein
VSASPTFDPLACTRCFTLATADNQLACDVPLVVERCAGDLPRASLRIVSPDYQLASNGLATGEVDAVFASVESMPRGYRWLEPLFVESGVFLVRRGHRSPAARWDAPNSTRRCISTSTSPAADISAVRVLYGFAGTNP